MVFTIFNDWADLAGRGNGRRGHGNQDGYGRATATTTATPLESPRRRT
jgi:hypothetical protein